MASRAEELLAQLLTDVDQQETGPDPTEMARCALRALALPEIIEVRPFLLPEVAIWGSGDGVLVAGRADALAITEGRVEAAIDWKSDIDPNPAVRNRYAAQLSDYLEAAGAKRGMLIFLSLGEISWVENPASLLAPNSKQGEVMHEARSSSSLSVATDGKILRRTGPNDGNSTPRRRWNVSCLFGEYAGKAKDFHEPCRKSLHGWSGRMACSSES